MRLLPLLAISAISAAPLLTGCHSAYVNAEIRNQTSSPITLVELDYPSASFGTQSIASGQNFKYRFKVLGSGSLKLLWTDSHNQEQHADGPELHEGVEGTLSVAVTSAGVRWSPSLNSR